MPLFGCIYYMLDGNGRLRIKIVPINFSGVPIPIYVSTPPSGMSHRRFMAP
jgi:hypothetical protein